LVAEFWFEITQDKIIRMKGDFMLRKENMLTSIRTLLDVLFFLAARGATRGGAFLYQRLN
jgi:hypothetical protein